jgi:type IV secretion system protein VirB3
MATGFEQLDAVPGWAVPVHKALTDHILLAGAPRAIAILNGTLAGAVGLGLRLWLVGLVIWAVGHFTAVWAARRDPLLFEVGRRHLRLPAHLSV